MSTETITASRSPESVKRFISKFEYNHELREIDLRDVSLHWLQTTNKRVLDKTQEMGKEFKGYGIDLSDPEQMLSVASGGLRMVGVARRYNTWRHDMYLNQIIERAATRLILDTDTSPLETIGAFQAYNLGRAEAHEWQYGRSTASPDRLVRGVSFAAFYEAKLWQQADLAASE